MLLLFDDPAFSFVYFDLAARPLDCFVKPGTLKGIDARFQPCDLLPEAGTLVPPL